ncbi:hypothetical protein WS84_28140 [Burkholderia anthina]|nr:hypothetical protein WS84_28140 [Burkholderia anthina]
MIPFGATAPTAPTHSTKAPTLDGIVAAMEKLKATRHDGVELAAKEKQQMEDKQAQAVKLAAMFCDEARRVFQPADGFKLSGPATLTIKTRQGQYKKKAFIGDEAFSFSSAYAGKRGDVIGVFKSRVPVDWSFMEMPINEACDSLNGFRAFADSCAGGSIGEAIENMDAAVVAAKAAERSAQMADPAFASW